MTFSVFTESDLKEFLDPSIHPELSSGQKFMLLFVRVWSNKVKLIIEIKKKSKLLGERIAGLLILRNCPKKFSDNS